MINALPSYYIPDYELLLRGRRAPAQIRSAISTVRFEQALEGADRVELHIASPDLGLLSEPVLQLDGPLALSLGYQPDGLVSVFDGNVTGVEAAFQSGGIPGLTVSAHSHMQRLTRGTKQRGFPYYLTDSVIAVIVAAENGLLSTPDQLAAALTGLGVLNARPRHQHKQSDYDFLRQIATEYGFEMWVEGDILNFKLLPPGLPPPEMQLRWGQSLLDFTPKLTSIGQIAAVTIKVWIEALKSQLAVSVSWDGERLSVRVAPAVLGEQSGVLAGSLDLPEIPHDTPVDAIKWVTGELRRRLNQRLTARGSSVGDPRLRAGRNLLIGNVGKFSGLYRITSVNHSLDASGYRTSFELRQELI